MNVERWLLFFVAYLFVTLSPGPNVFLVVRNALKYGYKVASITIFANLFCQLLIVISVALGAGVLLEQFPSLFFALKLIGGAYLIYLGITGLRRKGAADHLDEIEELSRQQFSYPKIAKEAFFVSASNPKTVIFLSAFLPQFISTEAAISWQFSIMFLTICFIVTSVHLVYSLIAKNINKKIPALKAKPIFSKISNSAFIAFGCGVLASSQTR